LSQGSGGGEKGGGGREDGGGVVARVRGMIEKAIGEGSGQARHGTRLANAARRDKDKNELTVRRVKASFFSGCDSHLATVAPASSNRSGGGGNETAEAFDGKYRKAVPRARQAITRVNAEQASKLLTREPTQLSVGEGRRGRCPGSNLIPATIPPG